MNISYCQVNGDLSGATSIGKCHGTREEIVEEFLNNDVCGVARKLGIKIEKHIEDETNPVLVRVNIRGHWYSIMRVYNPPEES